MARGAIRKYVLNQFGTDFYRSVAVIAIAGTLLSVILDIAMWFILAGYNPISQTISELAAGKHAWIQDIGICAFALSIAALAVAFAIKSETDIRTIALRSSLALLSATITVLAVYNEYGDGDIGGLEIHKYLVVAIGLLVPAILWISAGISSDISRHFRRILRVLTVFWLVAAPMFFFIPNNYDGIYERMLALILVGSVISAAIVLDRTANKGVGCDALPHTNGTTGVFQR